MKKETDKEKIKRLELELLIEKNKLWMSDLEAMVYKNMLSITRRRMRISRFW